MLKRIKIAHLHTAERGSFYRKAILVRTIKWFGVKTIMHHHAAEFEAFYEGLSNNKRKYVQDTLEMVDLNIVLSKRLISMITNKAPNARVKVLYNAVPNYNINPYNKDSLNCLFLGRLGKRKGTYDLLYAIKSIDDQLPQKTKFYFCGDGEIEEVKTKIKQLNIEHRIAHIGWVNEKQRKEILNNISINILPSYNEGLPMTILETMAYGIPNISTRIASIPEVIQHGENGFLVEPGNVQMLSEYILLLLNDRKKREEFSNNAYLRINESFSLDTHVNTLLKIYDELLE